MNRSTNSWIILTLALICVLANVGAGVSAMDEPRAEQTSEAHRIVIHVPARKLRVYSADQRLLRQYSVGVGRPQFPTPEGRYSVIRKVENPGWENPYKPAGMSRIAPGKNNPLGTRWIGFKRDAKGEYGIHGTNRPQSVGKFSSHGCVRMRVEDAEELYTMVSMGTPVEVSYERVLIDQKDNQLLITVFPSPFRGKPANATAVALKSEIRQRFPAAVIDEKKLAHTLKFAHGKPVVVGSTPRGPSTDDLFDDLTESQFSDVILF